MAGARPLLSTRILAAITPFFGGAIVGIGAALLSQVQLARFVRHEVGSLGPFSRLMGRISFLWRSTDEKVALALSDIPEAYLQRTWNIALGFVVTGLAMATLLAPWLRRRGRRRRSKS